MRRKELVFERHIIVEADPNDVAALCFGLAGGDWRVIKSNDRLLFSWRGWRNVITVVIRLLPTSKLEISILGYDWQPTRNATMLEIGVPPTGEICQQISAAIMARWLPDRETPEPARPQVTDPAHLTAREIDIARGLALGHTRTQISSSLGINIDTHWRNIKRKWRLTNGRLATMQREARARGY